MIYIVLTLISTLAKLLAFTHIKRIYQPTPLHKVVLVFIIMLIAQSTFELALYFYASDPESIGAYYALVGYYVCLFMVIACVPMIAIAASGRQLNVYIVLINLTIVGLIIFALLFTDWLIAGVELAKATGSLTKVSGQYYSIFQVAALLSAFFTVFILSPHNRYENYFTRVKTANLLISFIPICLFATFIVFAMALGIKFNAVGILPFCFLIYVAALVHNMHPQKQPDYLVFLPFTKKNKILMSTLYDLIYAHNGIDKKALDDKLIDYYLSQPDLTQKEVAKILNMSESTLSRRKNKKIKN